MTSQVQAVVRRWKWVTPGKTIVWARVRGAWRLSRIETIESWNHQGRPIAVNVIDINSAMRGENVKPYRCTFNNVRRLERPKDADA